MLWMAIVLSKLLIGLLYSTEGISFAKDLWSGSSFLEYIHSAIILYTSQYYSSSNKTKRMFEPHIYHHHVHLACTSVHYERKMYVLETKICIVKNLVCFNFVKVWALRSFLHWNFPDLWYDFCFNYTVQNTNSHLSLLKLVNHHVLIATGIIKSCVL